MDPITQYAISGPLLLATGLALLAGTVSFASPCVMPLVPGYLAYLAGLVGAEAPAVSTAERRRGTGRGRVAGAAGLFVLGFTAVFVAGTVGVLGLTDVLYLNTPLLQRVGGVVTIAMGLVFIGLIPVFQRDLRMHRVPRAGLVGAPLLGAVFGLGWTPCLGPTLSGVMSLAAGTEIGPAALRGLVLALAYCLGLGLPFVLIALGSRWALRVTGWLRAHVRGMQIFGGVLLLVVGTLLVTGVWGMLVRWLQTALINGVGVPL
ncbi:cytochrome c biogenesis CcdA family protein [Goodfellowiella coeruleoviolacea]|uniref:Cytochrome c-type biogenesis protein n=1 Tax=Goodfellowiella coeruleoviolacea TaxID=334858 RepID=A0AAE3GDX0_9PSEU|nr:cytochrome c biogenesis CcdA family protein [Goodfellowiella coeruleoviolacea]MCP2165963.1 cytochrome c-type biogenesis protein [Goodfellowiella coeruleoviolacea]